MEQGIVPIYDNIINDVEEGILKLIEEKLKGTFNLMDFQVELDPARINRFPAIMVATDRLAFNNITQNADTVRPRTHVYLLYRNASAVSKEKFKRHGVYPTVIGVARILSGQTLGIGDITPLNPESAVEVVSADLAERDIIMFDLALSWDFEIEETDFSEEEAANLVAIANKWLLGTHEAVEDTVSVKS